MQTRCLTDLLGLPLTSTIALVMLCLTLAAATAPPAFAEPSWDQAAAEKYLDARAVLWSESAKERRNLSTACLSCHTAVPYLLSRAALADSSMPLPAEDLFSDVEERVAGWSDARVWYEEDIGTDKPAQSRSTEAVLNALVLSSRDRRARRPLSDAAKAALTHMWAQQNAIGTWDWLHFELVPWETDGSDYWGAAVAAVASMSVADEFDPPRDAAAKLRIYLRTGLTSAPNLHNRIALLWVASAWQGLLSRSETTAVVEKVSERQQADGGFRPLKTASWWPAGTADGYSTAFATFVLQQVDDPLAARSAERGVGWLQQNQQADGHWDAVSANKDRSDQEAFRRLLMSDVATGFAVLALAPTAP